MPSLIDLRRRIRAVKNTQQITKAMKMVAASKLRRAQERIINARPYASQMQRVLSSVATRVDPSIHPLLTVREPRPDSKTLVIVVTGDKGLCGSFNTNAIKAGAAYILESPQKCTLGLVGRKGRDFFARRGFAVLFEQIGIFQKLRYEDARVIAQTAIDAFVAGDVDRVVLVYNEFRSVSVAARDRGPTAAHRSRGSRRRADAGAEPDRLLSANRRRRRSSISCSLASSRCRSIARCSSRTRPSSPLR